MTDTIQQPQAFYQDGKPVPAAKLQEALQRGEARFEKGATVYYRTPQGTIESTTAEQINRVVGTPLTPEEVKSENFQRENVDGGVNELRAYAEGAWRGATGGISDVLARHIGGEELAQEMLARKEGSPFASGFGDVVGLGGAIAAGVATGGVGSIPGLIGRGGAAVGRGAGAALRAAGVGGRGAVGRAVVGGAELAAGGALEGALYGGLRETGDAALEGADYTADRIAPAVLNGMLLGGVGAPVLGALGAGAKALGRRAVSNAVVAGKPLRESLQDFSDRAMVKAFISKRAAGQSAAKGLPIDEGRLASKIRAAKINPTRAGLAKVEKLAEEAAARPLEILKQVDRAALPASDRGLFSVPPISQERVALSVQKLREGYLSQGTKAGEDAAKAIDAQVAPLYSGFANGKFSKPSELFEWGTRMRASIPGGRNAEPLQALGRVIDDEIGLALKAAPDPQLRAQWQKAVEDVADYNTLRAGLTDVLENASGQGLSLRDLGVGGLAGAADLVGGLAGGSGLAAAAKGFAAAQVHKAARKHGGLALAKAADAVIALDRNLTQSAAAIAGVGKPISVKVPALFAGTSIAEQFQNATNQVHEIARSPDRTIPAIARAVEPLADENALLAQRVTERLYTIFDYIAQRHPTPISLGSKSLTMHLQTPKYSVRDMGRYLAEVETAIAPEASIQRLARGAKGGADHIKERIATLQALHPALYQEMRSKIMRFTSQRADKLSYQDTVYLSMLWDFAGDWSLMPENLSKIQAAVVVRQPPQVGQSRGQDGQFSAKISQSYSLNQPITPGGSP